jgi:TRAP-type transport system small permease protein
MLGRRLYSGLEKSILWLITLLFIGYFIAIILQVFSRYVMGLPIVWSEEVARYLDIWMVFLGAALITKHKKHLGVDIVELYLKRYDKKYTYIYSLIINVCMIWILPIIAYGSFILARNTWDIRLVTVPFPRGMIFVPLGISGCLMFVYITEQIINDIRMLLGKGGK